MSERVSDRAIERSAAHASLRERVRAKAENVDVLLFRVGGDLFATDLVAVEEALELGDVHPVPGAPPAMLGVLGLRGRLLPVYSPETALRLPPRGDRRAAYALVLRPVGDEEGTRALAVAVDDVEDVHRVDLRQVQDPGAAAGAARAMEAGDAAPGGVEHDAVLGVLRWNGDIVALVDPEALAAACSAAGDGQPRDARGEETA